MAQNKHQFGSDMTELNAARRTLVTALPPTHCGSGSLHSSGLKVLVNCAKHPPPSAPKAHVEPSSSRHSTTSKQTTEEERGEKPARYSFVRTRTDYLQIEPRRFFGETGKHGWGGTVAATTGNDSMCEIFKTERNLITLKGSKTLKTKNKTHVEFQQ